MESLRNTRTQEYNPTRDYLRVATATPEVAVADVATNIAAIRELYQQAIEQNVSLIVYPELSLTGYTIGDLVQNASLLVQAREGLATLASDTKGKQTAMVVGLPLSVGNAIYNTAAVVADGEVKGIVPKQNLPTYKEFYEKRWYQAWDERPNIEISIECTPVPFGCDQLFQIGNTTVGIEICEDLWVPQPPHERLVANGADIIVNPSASPEIASKSAYRRQLVGMTAARQVAGYLYSGADWTESTMDIVMSGHALISEGGRLLAERRPFDDDSARLTIADLDISHLRFDRRQTTNFPNEFDIAVTPTNIVATQDDLRTHIDAHPFIPHGTPEQVAERLDEIITIQSVGLARRFRSSGAGKMVLGLSGGLDSTLALLIAVKAAERINANPAEVIDTITMPSYASSERTQGNAAKLAKALNVGWFEIPIASLSDAQLASLGHDGTQDVTFENTQARIRTALLLNHANTMRGLVVGTGDLSEIALGWSTYNGDHISHYNPNASVPKTLIRALVRRSAEQMNSETRAIVADIIDTPISPELTGDGTLSQETEGLIGPYELHDFFEYHFVRWQEPFDKIEYLAAKAFKDKYSRNEVSHWLGVYVSRFFTNQWKRSVMPDGPKVGTVSHSPRGDWRMPSDLEGAHRQYYTPIEHR
ncbi:MAG: NAD(+) synthase [Candidatus Saccharimonas sp.]